MKMEKEYHKVRTQTIKRVQEPTTSSAEPQDVEYRPDAVVSQPKKVKKGLFERMVVGMIGPDGLPAVGRYVSSEVIGPAVKNMLVDTVINGIQMLVFKDNNQQYNRMANRDSARYGSAYSTKNTRTSDYQSNYKPSKQNYKAGSRINDWSNVPGQAQQLGIGVIVQDWAVADRMDSQKVLNALNDIAYQYGTVSVRDYYDLLGVPAVYTDNAYGWRWDDLQRVRVRTTREGFVLDLPPVDAI